MLLLLWACEQRISVVQAQRHVRSYFRQSSADAFAPGRRRRAATQRLMWAVFVKSEPFSATAVRLAAVGIAFEVDVLVLEQAPEPFDEHAVHPAAATVHRDAHAAAVNASVKAALVN